MLRKLRLKQKYDFLYKKKNVYSNCFKRFLDDCIPLILFDKKLKLEWLILFR